MKTKVSFPQALKSGLLAALVATVINGLLFYVFHASGVIADSIFIQPGQPMTILPIVISSIVPTLLAALVFFLLEKFTKKGFAIFRLVAIVLLLLSFINPFVGIQGVTVGYAVVLNLMHVVVVVALLYYLDKAVKKQTTAA